MSTSGFAGFHFLPPSLHLPVDLRPVHNVFVPVLPSVDTIASLGTVVLRTATANHVFPLVLGQT